MNESARSRAATKIAARVLGLARQPDTKNNEDFETEVNGIAYDAIASECEATDSVGDTVRAFEGVCNAIEQLKVASSRVRVLRAVAELYGVRQ